MHGIPYGMPPQGGLEATGGQVNVFPLNFPSRCRITKIIIQQTSDSPTSFTAAFYNRLGTGQGDPESESLSGVGEVPLPADLYRVTPDLDGVDGLASYFADQQGGLGYVFFSQDTVNQQQIARLGNSRVIYLAITPAGSGEFAVSIDGLLPG